MDFVSAMVSASTPSRRRPKKDPAGTFSWGGAYYTDFWVDPKHELIGIMMTQLYPSNHMKLRDEFHRLVNEAVQADRRSESSRGHSRR